MPSDPASPGKLIWANLADADDEKVPGVNPDDSIFAIALSRRNLSMICSSDVAVKAGGGGTARVSLAGLRLADFDLLYLASLERDLRLLDRDRDLFLYFLSLDLLLDRLDLRDDFLSFLDLDLDLDLLLDDFLFLDLDLDLDLDLSLLLESLFLFDFFLRPRSESESDLDDDEVESESESDE